MHQLGDTGQDAEVFHHKLLLSSSIMAKCMILSSVNGALLD